MKMNNKRKMLIAAVILAAVMAVLAGAAIVSDLGDSDADVTVSSSTTLPSGTVGVPYSYQLFAESADSTLYSGTMPPGLSVSGYYLTGTPTAAGTYTFVLYDCYVDAGEDYYEQYTMTVEAEVVDYVTAISVSPSSDTICVGDSITLTISLDSGTVYSSVGWIYSDSYVTKDSGSGLSATFTATAAGSIDIGGRVYANGITVRGTCSLTIETAVGEQTLTLDANGGNGTTARTVLAGNSTYLPTDGFTRTGYVLAGWNTASDGTGTSYDIGEEYSVAESATLYAVWQAASQYLDSEARSTCEVNTPYAYSPDLSKDTWAVIHEVLNYPSYAFTINEKPDWMTITKGTSSITFMGTPTSTGLYTVSVCMTDPGGSVLSYSTVEWTITVYDSSVSSEYTISYSAGDGTGTYDDMYGLLGTCIQLPSANDVEFTKDGYTLAAWAVDCNGTTVYYALGSIYTIDEDNADGQSVVFTAYYVADTGVIIFDANGGTMDVSSSAYAVQTDSQVTLPSSGLTRSGYTFAGWYLSSDTDAIYAPGYIYTISSATSTVVMHAFWIHTGDVSYSVVYNANGGTGTLSQSLTSGMYAVLPTAGYSYSGHTLESWNKASDGTGISYTPGGLFQITEAITLYAVWTDSESGDTYTVSFNLNGGSGGVQAQTVPSGSTATEPADPVRACYVFQYWQLQGSSGEYDFSSAVTQDITLTAIWGSPMFSISTDERTVTVSLGTDYSHRYAQIDWGDGDTEDGSEASYSHEYEAGANGRITVTVTVSGEDYSSFATYDIPTEIGGGGSDDDSGDTDDGNGTSLSALLVKILTYVIICAVLCIGVFLVLKVII